MDFAYERHRKWVFRGLVVCSVSSHSLPVCLGRAEPCRRSVVGAVAPAELRRKGSTRGDQPGLVGAVSWHLSWPHIQILVLPAALLTSAIYSTGTVPIHMAKN